MFSILVFNIVRTGWIKIIMSSVLVFNMVRMGWIKNNYV